MLTVAGMKKQTESANIINYKRSQAQIVNIQSSVANEESLEDNEYILDHRLDQDESEESK